MLVYSPNMLSRCCKIAVSSLWGYILLGSNPAEKVHFPNSHVLHNAILVSDGPHIQKIIIELKKKFLSPRNDLANIPGAGGTGSVAVRKPLMW